ncbi:MAG: aminopeptidase P family protein, partial [Clostridia bacterium]|nr:aminopeptidase P family protein [Clostridia bacterium]
MNTSRLSRVIEGMKKHDLPCILVSDTESIYYLTGRWIQPGERMVALVIQAEGGVCLFANRLFAQTATEDLPLVEYDDTEDCVAVLASRLPAGLRAIGVDKRWPSHFLIRLMEKRPGLAVKVGSAPVDEARMVKDAEEVAAMRESSHLNDRVLAALMETVKEGDTESGLGRRYMDIARSMGAAGCSFAPLICFGPNCAEPHHDSDETPLKKGDAIIFDVGLNLNMAMSDMTRTIFFGEPTEEMKKVYELVRRANLAGKAAVKPGVPLRDIDRAARSVIEEAGYGPYFTHRTGHNIGIGV